MTPFWRDGKVTTQQLNAPQHRALVGGLLPNRTGVGPKIPATPALLGMFIKKLNQDRDCADVDLMNQCFLNISRSHIAFTIPATVYHRGLQILIKSELIHFLTYIYIKRS